MKKFLVLWLVAGAFGLAGCSNLMQAPSVAEIKPTWEIPAGVKTMAVNGYPMAYVDHGSGVPIVLVHGAWVDYRYFVSQMEPLAAKHRVVAISFRHHYPERWDGKGDTYTMSKHVQDLAAFIQQLNAGPVHVVGHSRGGTAALLLAGQRPELVRSLIIAEGGTSLPAFDKAAKPGVVGPIARTILSKFDDGDVDGGLAVFAELINGPGAWEKTPEATRNSMRNNANTYRGTVGEFTPPFECADAERIKMPVRWLQGELTSAAVFPPVFDGLQKCIKQIERVIIPGAAHSMPRQAPAAFNAAVLSFVAKN